MLKHAEGVFFHLPPCLAASKSGIESLSVGRMKHLPHVLLHCPANASGIKYIYYSIYCILFVLCKK